VECEKFAVYCIYSLQSEYATNTVGVENNFRAIHINIYRVFQEVIRICLNIDSMQVLDISSFGLRKSV
jgi:hypothetical protein